jgi:hypothetical protein
VPPGGFLRVRALASPPNRAARILAFPLLALGVLLLPAPASATRIEYRITSSQDLGVAPFSGIFSESLRKRDHHDDHHHRHHHRHHDERRQIEERRQILSDDLGGLIALSTDAPNLFLDGQQLQVEVFSLMGSIHLCKRCDATSIRIELDPDFVSVLDVTDSALDGKIHLLLALEGRKKELTLRARGRTVDSGASFATPEFLSLLLDLDFFRNGRHGGDLFGRHGCDDYHDAGKQRIFLQAQGAVVPEPESFGLLGGGLLALAFARRSRRPVARLGEAPHRRASPPVRGQVEEAKAPRA